MLLLSFFVVCFFKDDNFHELNEAIIFPWGASNVSQHKINVKSILQVNTQVIQAVKTLTMQLFTQHHTDVHLFGFFWLNLELLFFPKLR